MKCLNYDTQYSTVICSAHKVHKVQHMIFRCFLGVQGSLQWPDGISICHKVMTKVIAKQVQKV